MITRLFRFILSACFFALLAGVLGVGAGLSAARAPGPLTLPQLVVVDKGLGTRGVAALLEKTHVIRHRSVFLIASVLGRSRDRLQAGEYEFPARASVFEILDQMAAGRVYQRKLTIPEGLSSFEILALVSTAEGLTGDLSGPVPAEGTLLPETYLYTRGETRLAIIGRMAGAMRQATEKLWATRAPDFPLKSITQVLTLASIVEKETGAPEERPRVASVFFNRLQLGMKLQSDPTVIYALTSGKAPLGRALTTHDLENAASPYNTYLYAGLPPGPIANPGLASLKAVFEPEKTDYLYFVADGTGGHAFARTLEAHNENVARWRNLKKERP